MFILVYGLIWITALALFLLFPRIHQAKTECALILALSLGARAAWLGHPASDDVNRYLWEGFLIIKGISPYHHAPVDPGLSILAQGFTFFKGINHPEISAAYPPVLLYFFSWITRLWQNPMAIKIAMALLDVCVVYLLMVYLAGRGKSRRWALVYALNPLVLVSFAGQGHGDALQAVFLLASLCLHEGKSPILMFVCLGLAVQSKIVAIVVVPFFLSRENVRFFPVFLITIILPCLPFLAQGPGGLIDGLVVFGKYYAFNGPVLSLLQAFGLGSELSRMICAVAFAGALAMGILMFRAGGMANKEKDPVPGILWALGSLILFSPTVHAWYLCWVLPFAVIRQKQSFILLSLTLCFYYVVLGVEAQTGQWLLPGWAMIPEWLPFVLVLLVEAYYFMLRFSLGQEKIEALNVSVIVPVINEEHGIAHCVKQIMHDVAVLEVIVVDGGSTDRTIEEAHGAGARVIVHDKSPDKGGGRGGQIHRGVSEAKGDVVVVVHADTRTEMHAFTTILTYLSLNPQVVGGAVGTIFNETSFRMKIIEFLNGFRAVFLNIPFGDQMQFFRRRPVVEKDFFPAIPLMEDVEFSLRLPSLGQTGYLFGGSQVSSRRWNKEGFKNMFTVIYYFGIYLLQRIWKTPDTVAMYRRYYKK